MAIATRMLRADAHPFGELVGTVRLCSKNRRVVCWRNLLALRKAETTCWAGRHRMEEEVEKAKLALEIGEKRRVKWHNSHSQGKELCWLAVLFSLL